MSSDQCKIYSLRDFLIHLPKLVPHEYDDVVRYIVWKVLRLSLEADQDRGQAQDGRNNPQIDWDSIVSVFTSENWGRGVYKDILRDVSWKEKVQPPLSETCGDHRVPAGCMCGRLCYPLETVYYCFTCTMNPLYEICEYCFDRAEHLGHVYTAKLVVRPEGRVCHWGDTSIFKGTGQSGSCEADAVGTSASATPAPVVTNSNTKTCMSNTFNTILDYLIDVTIYFKDRNEAPLSVVNFKKPVRKPDDNILFKIALEDSGGSVPEETDLENGIGNNRKWAVQIDEEDCNIHCKDLASKIARIFNKPAEFAISLTKMLEDGHPSVILAKSPDISKIQKISTILQQEGIHSHVRNMEDVFKRELINDVVEWLYIVSTEETVDLRRRKALRLSMLDAWQSGLRSAKFTPNFLSPYVAKLNLLGGFLVSYEQHDTFPWFKPWNFTNINDPKITDVMSNYDKRLADTNVMNTISRFHPLHGSRFQYILAESTQFLSRFSRYRMLKVLSSLFTITDDAKNCLAAQYFDIYLSVLYSTVASDSTGFKVSLMSIFSQYTFQHPDTANLAIRNCFVQRALKFAFTLMAFTSDDLLAYLPIPLSHDCKLPNETIRNRRTIMCFKDICILMSTNTIPLELLQNNDILSLIVESFGAFNNILRLKRETAEHVEFESFDFSSYYFYFSSVLVMVDGFIRSISIIDDKETRKDIVVKLIKMTMKKELQLLAQFRKSVSSTFLWSSFASNEDKPALLPIIKEKICGHVANIINFQVGVDTQNFFNPMSYLFKFVLQWSQCGRYAPAPHDMVNYLDFNEIFQDKQDSLFVCESALSTLVLLGQINVGFWVRNGSPITHQARMYTKYSMREFTYMSDLFNVQFSMSHADPDEFMVTYIARWGLKHWSNGVPVGDYPQRETTVSIVYECILLLVQLLTEIKSLTLVSSVDGFEKTLKAEIVHALCFRSCTYSQIMECIPEHITKHAAFDLYLEKFTNFTPPSGLTDHGQYSLKKQYIADIEPYYVALSSSKRYEVEKKIRVSMASKKHINYDDTFVPAKDVIGLLKQTPYSRLYAISSVDTFGLFLKSTLELINKFNHDSLLPVVVHLIHQCVVNNLNDFMKIFWHEFASVDTEFYYYNSIGSILYGLLLKECFTQVHGKIREVFRYLAKTAAHVDIKSYLQEQTESFNETILWSSSEMKATKDGKFEKKKRLARSRKEKMLRELAKQQLQFIENNSLAIEKEYMRESSPESLETSKTLGWEFPGETCVFCKMTHEEDAFIFFSYQENNICDHGINFDNKLSHIKLFSQAAENSNLCDEEMERMKFSCVESRVDSTREGAVLRTCGHGAHISCLGNHMKTIRAAHNQTTKNVPVAYGFGLMYCPLCNGLCNSFLPQLTKGISRSASDFFKVEASCISEDTRSLLLSASIKAARIFQDLVKEKSEKNKDHFNALDTLFVNTISNTELATRTGSGSFAEVISSPRLLTLRLLNELILFLHHHIRQDNMSMRFEYSWQQFLLRRIDTDFLLVANQAIKSVNQCESGSSNCVAGLSNLSKVKNAVKGRIIQDMLILAKEMLQVEFYNDCPEVWKMVKQPISDFPYDTTRLEVEVDLIVKMFTRVVSFFSPEVESYMNGICHLRFQIHGLLTNSLGIFLRRFSIMFYAQYAVGTELEPFIKSPSSIDILLLYLKLPRLSEILQEFDVEQSLKAFEATMGFPAVPPMSRICPRLKAMKFSSPLPVQLVKLPHSLSHFFLSEKDNLMHKVLKDDIAFCLFCGKQCNLRKSVSLHGYALGVCTNHVRNECSISSTYGMFLMIRSNSIYLSYGERGTFYSAPYLDKHGEPDVDFKYNTPVFLDEKRYEHLCNGVMLDNMIPHIVLRLTDGNSDLGGWETM